MSSMPLLYDALQKHSGISFIQLEPPSARVPQPPRFLFGTFSEYLSEYYFRLIHLHQMGVFVCQKAEVRAPYLIVHDGAVMACPQANLHQAHLDEFLSQGAAATEPKTYGAVPGDSVMAFGPGYQIFGHWMVDFLPKIYLVERAGFTVLTLRTREPFSGWFNAVVNSVRGVGPGAAADGAARPRPGVVGAYHVARLLAGGVAAPLRLVQAWSGRGEEIEILVRKPLAA